MSWKWEEEERRRVWGRRCPAGSCEPRDLEPVQGLGQGATSIGVGTHVRDLQKHLVGSLGRTSLTFAAGVSCEGPSAATEPTNKV